MLQTLAGLITALVLAILSPWQFALAADTIRVRVTDFPPQYFISENHWTGLDVELAEAVVTDAGFSIEYVNLPWSRALAYIQNGQLDIMMNMTRTPERELYLNFIGPERTSVRELVVRRENLDMHIENLDQLADAAKKRNQQFGIQKDVKYSDEFDARLASDPAFSSRFDPVFAAALLAKKTQAGHNLGFVEELTYSVYQLKHSPDFAELAIHPFVLSTTQVYFGVSKQLDLGKLERLRAAYERLEKSGALAKIRDRWEKDQ